MKKKKIRPSMMFSTVSTGNKRGAYMSFDCIQFCPKLSHIYDGVIHTNSLVLALKIRIGSGEILA